MKIVSYGHAYVGSGWSAGGETTLHDLLSFLAGRGWDVEFVMSEPCKNGKNDYIIDGVQVRAYTDHRQPIGRIATADLVVSHLGGAQRSSIIAKNNGVHSVHVIHNDHPYTKAMARHASYLIYNTEWVLGSFRDSRVPRPAGMVVHPPVNPKNYKVRSSRQHITCVNLSDGSEGHYDKGSKMFYALAERFPEEKFLGVIGAYGQQDVRTGYPNVTFMEHTQDIREAFRKTKIVLAPSKYESYGRVPIEAACSGIPTISSLAQGFKESAVPVHYADYQDVDGWETHLRDVLDHYSIHSTNAKRAVESIWDKSQQELDEFEQVMISLASQRRTRRR